MANRMFLHKVRGFTLIELLIVVAIIGIIAVLLIPNLIDAMQKAKQKRTMADMKLTGSAWFSWLTDQVGAAAAGSRQIVVDWTDLQSHGHDDLVSDLVPQYAAAIPPLDGWNRTFEFAVSSDLEGPFPIGIRSPGSDGVYSASSYTAAPFVATDYEQDIVWTGGFFVRWPSGLSTE